MARNHNPTPQPILNSLARLGVKNKAKTDKCRQDVLQRTDRVVADLTDKPYNPFSLYAAISCDGNHVNLIAHTYTYAQYRSLLQTKFNPTKNQAKYYVFF